jgi:hypothetical protein
MTNSVVLHLLGSMLVLLMVRLGGGSADPLFQAQAIGWLLILVALGLTMRSRSDSDGGSNRWSLRCQLVSLVALVGIVAVSLDQVDLLGLNEEARNRAEVLIQAVLALLWFVSIVPMITVERVRSASPVMLPKKRISEAGFAGLGIAFAISMMFPLNYVAHETNVRWDHSYFKTASPGDVTLASIENLEEPIQAWLFFPTTLDVTEEIRTYFDQIASHPGASSKIDIAFVDHALEGDLAKELKVQKNGTIALVRGTGEDQQVQRIRIGDAMEKAERKLKRLDEEVSKAMLKLATDPRQAYVTVGHGEMYWKKGRNILPARSIESVKSELKRLNFKVSELGAAQGLASEIPEDADLVLILGPTEAFLAEELDALNTYRAQGGALWIAMDPGSKADMSALLTPLGLSYSGADMLVGDTNIWVATRRVTDRYNIFTNKVSTHPSVTTLSRNSKTRALLVPLAAPLSQLPNSPHKVEITVRSLPEVWVDTNSNLRFDDGVEERKTWPIAAAVSGGSDETGDGFRALVMGDATWASDLVLPLSMGNQEFFRDGLGWLVQDPSTTGSVNDEEDVKIRHTKKDEAWIFYGTTLLVPVLIFLFGSVRVRNRRSGGAV